MPGEFKMKFTPAAKLFISGLFVSFIALLSLCIFVAFDFGKLIKSKPPLTEVEKRLIFDDHWQDPIRNDFFDELS